MACIIYYQNLDYDLLPTSRKKARIMAPANNSADLHVSNGYHDNDSGSTNQTDYLSAGKRSYDNGSQVWRKGTNKNNTNGNANTNTNNYNNTENYNNNYNKSKSYTSSNTNKNNKFSELNNYNNYSSSNHNFTANHQSGSFVTYDCSSSNSDGLREQTPYNMSTSSNTSTIYYQSSGDTMDCYSPSPKLNEIPDERLLLNTLKSYFKFDSFRTNQLEAIKATCSGLDTLILMPTGGGKSICYQLPAILTSGVSVVVSPLKSLIDDQVITLRSLKVKTSALSGQTTEDEANDIFYDLKSHEPKHKLLYVTPEKINCSSALINLFKCLHSRNLLARFVIDEAHCVSMWGADFRPDYRKLGKLRDLFRDVPIMALTATAPPKVQEDIVNQLKMKPVHSGGTKVFIQSFNRPNLKFEVKPKSKGCIVEICNMIRKQFQKKCGIIYCLSRNDCETVAEKVREHGITSAPYHAGLSDIQRKKVFQAWSTGVFQVVCATIAFGMGIDKSNVRFVIHYSVPKSIEGYYQEAGRAGRDGQMASCILYFSKSDLYRMKSMLSKGFGRKAEDKKRDQTNLEHIISYVDNKNDCRRSILLRYLGQEFDRNDCIRHFRTACDNCLAHRSTNCSFSSNID